MVFEFPTIEAAHAALGSMLTQQLPMPTTETPAEVAPVVPGSSNAPAVQDAVDIANAASAAMEAEAEAEAPPKKKRTGRPKGSKDSKPRKGSIAAGEGITIEDMGKKLQVFANNHGFKAARTLLSSYGIKRVSELDPDRFFKFDLALSQPPVEEAAS